MTAPPFASAFRRQSWKVNRLAVPRPRSFLGNREPDCCLCVCKSVARFQLSFHFGDHKCVWVQFPAANGVLTLIMQIAQLSSVSTSNHESSGTASPLSWPSSAAACLLSAPALVHLSSPVCRARKSPPPTRPSILFSPPSPPPLAFTGGLPG